MTPNQLVEHLNRLLSLDPETMERLFPRLAPKCNTEFAHDPW